MVKSSMHSKLTAYGFLLLETMIAALVLALSLIGLAGMQLTAIKTNHSAMLRSESAIHIANMADRMRANIPAIMAGRYSLNYGGTPYTAPRNRAQHDITDWLGTILAVFPNAQAQISCHAPPNCSFSSRCCSISIRWDDSRGKIKTQRSVSAPSFDSNFTLTTTILF